MNEKNNDLLRSPFFYVGDKYKLLKQLLPLFPENIKGRFVEPFVGGGSVYLNTNYNKCLLNDANSEVIELHKFLSTFQNIADLEYEYEKYIKKYKLTYSFKNKDFDKKILDNFPKTYFAEINRENYLNMRQDFNNSKNKDLMQLYVLMIYGFNRMLRFNSEGNFNIPVGNVDFNKNVYDALEGYINKNKFKKIRFLNYDYKDFFNRHKFNTDDFIYIDPPYLISKSEYNKNWGENNDYDLYEIIDDLNSKKIRFVLSNILSHKEKENEILKQWSKKYNLQFIDSNYISYHDNSQKNSKEVVVKNF